MRLNFKWSIIVILIFSCIKCDNKLEPNIQKLQVYLGRDQTICVANYVVLTANTGNYSPDSNIKYNWSTAPSNPANIKLYTGDSEQLIGFTIPGIYKIMLQATDEAMESPTDTIKITVNPRENDIIEDPFLELDIRYTLSLPTVTLTHSILLGMDSLMAPSLFGKITSLKGLENCQNLEKISLNFSRVTDISPLAILSKLKRLEISQTWILCDISPLANLTTLTYLNIDGNKVSDLSPLAKLTNLTYLNALYNPIEDVSVLANLINLQELWLNRLSLKNVSFLSNLPKLTSLWIAGCGLNDISIIKNCKNLKELDLDDNEIADISVLKELRQLEWVSMDNNQIENISALQNLPNLKIVNLIKNKIVDILPLVENPALKKGCLVALGLNPLNEKSINEYIPILKKRGVAVVW